MLKGLLGKPGFRFFRRPSGWYAVSTRRHRETRCRPPWKAIAVAALESAQCTYMRRALLVCRISSSHVRAGARAPMYGPVLELLFWDQRFPGRAHAESAPSDYLWQIGLACALVGASIDLRCNFNAVGVR